MKDICKYPGGPQAAWDNKRQRGDGGGPSLLHWVCASCSYSNLATRRTCRKCEALPGQAASSTRTASVGRSNGRSYAAVAAQHQPEHKGKGARKRDGNGQGKSCKGHGKSAAKGSFYQAVVAEAAKYAPEMENGMDTTDDETDRERLQAELKKVEAAVQTLEAMPPDEDIAPILASRRAKRDDIRARLHAARPVRSQLRAAEEARDRACRQHSALSEAVHSLKLILQAKTEELDTSTADVAKAVAAVDALQALMVQEEGCPAPATPMLEGADATLCELVWFGGRPHSVVVELGQL